MDREMPWTHADFQPGAALGAIAVALDARRLALWNSIYGEIGGAAGPDGPVPHGLIVAAMMEGYIGAIQPRPPGNIHAGQRLAFTGHAVRPEARLAIAFTCKGKEIRRGRRWLALGVTIHDGDALVADGEIVSIWAR